MRRWAAPVAALVILLFGALWYQQQLSRSRTRFPAPDFALRDLKGTEYRLSQLRGKVVMLNIWATWCPPCREEMPSMESLHRRFAGQDFVILAASQDEAGQAAVQPYVEETGLTFPVLIDSTGEVGRKFGVTGYPETFIIGKDGMVFQRFIGPEDWRDERLQTMLRQLIALQPDGDRPPT